jgi:hypothetical protein
LRIEAVSREALSLDISQVVSRVVRGEPIDPTEKGAALAAKYPDLGMSAELIGAAITRAAGMVGRIRDEPLVKAKPAKPQPPMPAQMPKANGVELDRPIAVAPSMNGGANGSAVGKASGGKNGHPTVATPPLSRSIDEALASAIDAEIGALVTGQTAQHKGRSNGAEAPRRPNGTEAKRNPGGAEAQRSGSTDAGPASGVGARLRKAFFRH